MALNLDDEKAIDYGNDTPLLPFEEAGEFDLSLIDYNELISESELDLRRRELAVETGRKPDQVKDEELPKVAFNGACDIATCRVISSNNASYPPGTVVGLYFDHHAEGKAKKFAIGRNRSFMAAVVGDNPKSPTFKANDARKALLGTDLSSGEAHFHLSRRERAGRGDYQGQTFANDTYRALD